MVLATFVSQALAGRPLTIFGGGMQTRCFLHAADCVRMLAEFIDCPAAYGEAVNVGSTEEVSINDLASLVIRMTGSRSRRSAVSDEDAARAGFEDIPRRVPAPSKLEALIGARPLRSLEEIIADVMAAQQHGRDGNPANRNSPNRRPGRAASSCGWFSPRGP